MATSLTHNRSRAVAVAVVVLLATAAAVAAWTWISPASNLPERLGTSTPELGDGAAFSLTASHLKPAPEPWLRVVEARADTFRMADGQLAPARQVVAEGNGYDAELATGWRERTQVIVIADDGHRVAVADVADETRAAQAGPCLGGSCAGDVAVEVRDRRIGYHDGHDCLLRHALQGRSLSLDDAIPLLPACDLAGLADLPGLAYRAEAVETAPAGVQAVRFDAAGDGWRVSAWVAPGSPYLVRLVAAGPPGTFDVQLAAALVGDGEDGVGDAVQIQHDGPFSAPDATFAPLAPWGPDDTGTSTGFSPREAYERALNDPSWDGLRNWVAEHPDHVAIETSTGTGWYLPGWWGSYRIEHRSLVLSDGEAALRLGVNRHEPAPGPAGVVPATGVHYEFNAEPVDVRLPVAPRDLPPVPTWESLEARAVAFYDARYHSDTGSLWHMEIDCEANCTPEDWVITVGNFDFTWSSTPSLARPGFQELDWTMQGASFGADATARAVREGWVRHDAGNLLGAVQSHPAAPTQIATAREVPGAALAVSVGAASILLALLAKSMGLGLFSRLREDELLNHPKRRALHDLVHNQPGSHFHHLQRATGMANGTLIHHLEKLVAANLLRRRREGGYTCYYPPGPPQPAAGAVKSPGGRRVLAAISDEPGISLRCVARRTGLDPATVSHHVKRLEEGRLIEVARQRPGGPMALSAKRQAVAAAAAGAPPAN